MFKTVKLGIFIGIISALLFNCAGTAKKEQPQRSSGSTSKMDESFDPLLLNDEDMVFDQKTRQVSAPTQPITLPVEIKQPEHENKLIDGFRIQILSTKNLENATKAKHIALEQFEDLKIRFYLDFDSPYYKIRLGDFKTREECERIRETVRSRGYPKAWIVPSKVWSNPVLPVSADSIDVNPLFPEN